MKSFWKVKFPVIIAGVQATVTPDVVESDIPLLLSKEATKKAKIQIDFQEDKINKFDKKLNVFHFNWPLLFETQKYTQWWIYT